MKLVGQRVIELEGSKGLISLLDDILSQYAKQNTVRIELHVSLLKTDTYIKMKMYEEADLNSVWLKERDISLN